MKLNMSASYIRRNIYEDISFMPILVDMRPDASVRGHLIVGISGLIPPEDMSVHPLSFLCVV